MMVATATPDPEGERPRFVPLGTGQFRDPEEVADYHTFEPGDFWLGRCPISGAPLGHADDRHVLLVSGTREGKGTGVIIPNLCLWEGSAVVIDPKGENASITAARRGDGSEYAEGMGQDVYVLDPFRMANVDEKYRVRMNPLDELDISSGTFAADLRDLVVAMMPLAKEEEQSGIWTKLGRRLLMQLIMHVLTCEDFEGRRNLITVRRLLTLGDYELYKTLEDAGQEDLPPPMALLWESMRMNPAFGGVISAAGHDYIDNAKNNPKRNGDIRLNAVEETDFLDVEQFKDLLGSSDFSLSELKTNPKGVTIYLCLPFHRIGSFYPWLRLMVTLGLAAAQADKSEPACGKRTLFCLDEFASLKRMEPVKDAMATIAGYHVTMFLVVQGLGQLEDIYGKGSEEIVENCGLQIHFGVGQNTAKQLSSVMGETEVIRVAGTSSTSVADGTTETHTASEGVTDGVSRSKSRALSRTETQTINKALTHTASKGATESRTNTQQQGSSHGTSQAQARSEGMSEQWGENWNESEGKSSGVSHGSNRGRNKSVSGGKGKSESWAKPGHGIFGDIAKFIPWVRENETVNYQTQEGWSEGYSTGTSTSVNTGTNRSKGRGGNRGGGRNSSTSSTNTQNENVSASQSTAVGASTNTGSSDAVSNSEGSSSSSGETVTEGETTQHSTTRTNARATGKSKTTTETGGENESVHKRPLMTPDEIQVVFGREDEKRRPGEAAWALVLLKGHRPAVIHRSPYFRDVGFRWLFDAEEGREPGPKLIGPIETALPPVKAPEFELLAPSFEWCVVEGETVERGRELLTVEVAGPRALLSEGFLEDRKYDIGLTLQELGASGDVHSERLQIPIYAAATGTITKHELEGDGSTIELTGNQRHHYEHQNEETPDPMAEYLTMLADLQKQQSLEQEQARERKRAEEERKRAQREREAEEREAEERASAAAAKRAAAEDAYAHLSTALLSDAKRSWWESEKKGQWVQFLSIGALFGLVVLACAMALSAIPVLGVPVTLAGLVFLILFSVEEMGLGSWIFMLGIFSERAQECYWHKHRSDHFRKCEIEKEIIRQGRKDVIDALR